MDESHAKELQFKKISLSSSVSYIMSTINLAIGIISELDRINKEERTDNLIAVLIFYVHCVQEEKPV